MRNLDFELSQVTRKLDLSACTVLVVPYRFLDLGSSRCEEERLQDHILACRHHDDGVAFLCALCEGHVHCLCILVDLHRHVVCCEIVHHSISSL